MIFRQLFEPVSSAYTYILATRRGGEALIIDPVLEKVDRYLRLMQELEVHLVKALDTHLHHDHITGIGALRDRTRCTTVIGKQSKVDVVSMRLADRDQVEIEGLALDVIYTPGHTDDSYSFRCGDRVFTGDTLLIRGTGRTDFENGDPRAEYESLFGRLLKLPDETLVYPGHDYKGDTVSTIGEERAWNPRLQVKSAQEYVDLMNSLRLPNPKMMDVAVPANMRQGLAQEQIARRSWAYRTEEAKTVVGKPNVALIDLREKRERERDGKIPGDLHLPYRDLQDNISANGVLRTLAASPGRELLFSVLSANAPRWRCRLRRTSGSAARGTSRGVSMPGRRRAAHWTIAPAAEFMRAVKHDYERCVQLCWAKSEASVPPPRSSPSLKSSHGVVRTMTHRSRLRNSARTYRY
jgi:sulfur dioxygenase